MIPKSERTKILLEETTALIMQTKPLKSEWTKILLEETTALIMQSNSSAAEQLQKEFSCM